MPPPTFQTVLDAFTDAKSKSITEKGKILQEFIDAGFDINTVYKDPELSSSTSLLIYSVTSIDPDLTNLLIDKGADINKQPDEEFKLSILAHTLRYSHYEEFYKLSEKIAKLPQLDINIRQYPGQVTYFYLAIEKLHIPVMKILISRGVDINATDEANRTALILVVTNDDELDRDNIDYDNLTEDDKAIMKKISDAVELLLDSGADVSIRDNTGYCAQDYADERIIGEDLYKLLEPLRDDESEPGILTIGIRNLLANNKNQQQQQQEPINIPVSKETIEVFDAYEAGDVSLSLTELSADTEHIYFKIGPHFFRVSREYITNSIKDYSGIFFECKEKLLGSARLENIHENMPYILIRSSAQYLLPLSQIKAALRSPVTHVFELTRNKTLQYVTAFGSVVRPASSYDYAGRMVNITSADHCQEGSGRDLFSITPIKLVYTPVRMTRISRKRRYNNIGSSSSNSRNSNSNNNTQNTQKRLKKGGKKTRKQNKKTKSKKQKKNKAT